MIKVISIGAQGFKFELRDGLIGQLGYLSTCMAQVRQKLRLPGLGAFNLLKMGMHR